MNLPIIQRPRPRIRQWTTYDHATDPHHAAVAVEHSLTIPDQSLTVAEILKKHHRMLPPIQTMPVYNSLDVPNLNTLDIQEIRDYRSTIKERSFDLRNLLVSQRDAAIAKPIAAARAKRKAAADLAKRALTLKAAAEAGIDPNSLTD